MHDVEMDKDTLMGILVRNRHEHVTTHEAAIVEYRRQRTATLRKMARYERAEDFTHDLDLHNLPKPEYHRDDYDRALAMLNHETRDTVVLSETEYAELVLDQWQWKSRWFANTESYAAAANARG